MRPNWRDDPEESKSGLGSTANTEVLLEGHKPGTYVYLTVCLSNSLPVFLIVSLTAYVPVSLSVCLTMRQLLSVDLSELIFVYFDAV